MASTPSASGDGPAYHRSPSNLRGWRSSAQPFPRGQVRARVPASVIAPGATVHRGQGYMVAPRLAGQRAQYIESQLRSYREHTRDNPFSKQYMWGAVAALRPHEARDLAIYFATLTPRAANGGRQGSRGQGKNNLSRGHSGIQYCVLLCLSWPERGGRERHSSPGGSAWLALLTPLFRTMLRRLPSVPLRVHPRKSRVLRPPRRPHRQRLPPTRPKARGTAAKFQGQR